jgi:flagellar L-ring protein precursor FlgH
MKEKILTLTLLGLLLSGCRSTFERLSYLDEPPPLSRIKDPTTIPGYEPVSMPMPEPIMTQADSKNSLWQTGSKAFFKDQRAGKVGDILTVNVDVKNEQSFELSPDIDRASKVNSNLTNLLGWQRRLPVETKMDILNNKVNNENKTLLPNLANLENKSTLKTTGKYNVKDNMKFTIASHVTQILPNGTMVIEGRQELGLSNEVREIHITGIIRREDLDSTNSIALPKIAQLRISYRGRGELTDMANAPIGHQIVNKVLPF